MTTTFSIEAFAADCKRVMDAAPDRKQAARELLQETIAKCGADEIIRVLQAAVPPGASIGELIVYSSPELTMLYGRMPGRFQSGIHDHTVCAVIGQLRGTEINRFYAPQADGKLAEVGTTTVRTGEVIALDRDVIHSIENPGEEQGHALHLYSGDFRALSPRRSLWSWTDREKKPFTFPELLQESATAMHESGNQTGLDQLVQAMPASKAFVDTLGK